jgi:hypothetical protein
MAYRDYRRLHRLQLGRTWIGGVGARGSPPCTAERSIRQLRLARMGIGTALVFLVSYRITVDR